MAAGPAGAGAPHQRAQAEQRKLRVALLTRKWSVRGGNERVATEVARLLLDRGHEVSVVCQKVDASAKGLVPAELIHDLRGASFDPTLAMLSFAARARRWFERAKAAGEFDLVLGFNHSVAQDVYRLGGGTHAEYMRLKAAHGLRGGGPVLDRAALWLERQRFLPDRYSALIAPSVRVRDELIHHYEVPRERIEVVYNGVDGARFAPDPRARAEERRAWGISEGEPVALFVGQDLERKGFAQAVRATGQQRCALVYVGQAKRPRALPPHVRWIGERRDIERCYAAADVFLLPSFYDPFGGAVLEAYAAGLPAVATDRIGATELAAGSSLSQFLISDPQKMEVLCEKLEAAIRSGRACTNEARAIASAQSLDRFRQRIESVLTKDLERRGA